MQPLPPGLFIKYQSLIYKESGIRLDERKSALLASRLRKRLTATGQADAASYYAWLKSPAGRQELPFLLDVVTTNETSFYRTEKHFDWFSDVFLPERYAAIPSGQSTSPLRVWSAACSIGAEPYTLAFCYSESPTRSRLRPLHLFATDLSEDSLNQARAGVYKSRLVEGLPEKRRSRYFKESDGNASDFVIRAKYREMVQFQIHNLIKPLGEPPFDCVFLRNVLIYFDDDSKRKVLQHVHDAICPGGYLVVGPSEGIYGLPHDFEKVDTFLYRRRLGRDAEGKNSP